MNKLRELYYSKGHVLYFSLIIAFMLFSSICAIVNTMELYMRTVSIIGTFLIPGILLNKFSDALSIALARKAVKELEESGELDEIFKNEKDTQGR